MKVVINRCYGGFGLSEKAYKRIAELLGKTAYFYEYNAENIITSPDRYLNDTQNVFELIHIEDSTECFHRVYDTPDMNELYKEATIKDIDEWKKDKKKNNFIGYASRKEIFKGHEIPDFCNDRENPFLIQVVEELGKEASDSCANLVIEELPDGATYIIEGYDGNERIEPGIRSYF